MSSTSDRYCLFCGVPPDLPEDLIRGRKGDICRSCVWSLSTRLAEAGRTATAPDDVTGAVTLPADSGDELLLPSETTERSAHDYQTSIDLAAAYMEMGRRNAAVNELLSALESAIICDDFQTGLQCIARCRQIADSPSLRDTICALLTRLAPTDEEA